MNEQSVRVAIDFAGTKVRVMVAQLGDKVDLQVLALSSVEAPVKHGVITNLEAVKKALAKAVAQVEKQINRKIQAASVNISGADILALNSDAKLALRQGKITQQDVDEVILQAREYAKKAKYYPIHSLTQKYVVDEHEGIDDPVGMAADKIEARIHTISATSNHVHNIIDCVESLDIDVINLVFSGFAVSQVATSPEERELGVCVIDIGAETMDYMIWQYDQPLHSGVIRGGGQLVSSDLAIILGIQPAFAETLKCQYGHTMSAHIKKAQLDVPSTGTKAPNKQVDKDEMVDVIVARYTELFDNLKEDWRRAGIDMRAIGNIVLTGGGAQLPGLATLAEDYFATSVRVACPEIIAGLPDCAQYDSGLYTLLGLIELQYKPAADYALEKQQKTGIIVGLKDWITRYL